MTNIILCGGSGTRLWPLSRQLMPKQFLKLFNEKSLFQLTVERNQVVCESQFIVSNAEQYFLALDQIKKIEVHNTQYLLEPIGRNTAPAIALACLALDEEEIVLVTPSDHLIKDDSAYIEVLTQAKDLAMQNYLVTFGITPTFAETGFGYIESEGTSVKAFHEKPDSITAQSYIDAGNYYWNSGMFCFKAGIFLSELKKYSPQIYTQSLHAYNQANKEDIIRIGYQDMAAILADSIDYAVMEKSDIVKVIASDIGWSDVGSFDALAEELPNDKNNNLILSDKHVELLGIKDSIVVDTSDALLIAKKGDAQSVKEIVQRLKIESKELTQVHSLVHRPWGTYEVLYSHKNYKIKRIVVYPGERLSLQKHLHRNEHWVVVKGEAMVQIGEEISIVKENESTYIKQNEIHRLTNNTREEIVLIEAQVGSYTGEDDIIRLEDDYRRVDG